jgi:hypothetical protein
MSNSDVSSDDDFSLSSDDDFEEEVVSTKSKSKSKSTSVSVATKSKTTTKRTPEVSSSSSSRSNVKRPSSVAAASQDATPLKKMKMPETSIAVASVAAPTSHVVTKGPPVASAAEAKSLIKSYMLSQNRPFSCIQVFDNLHHRVTKTDVQKGLIREFAYYICHNMVQ